VPQLEMWCAPLWLLRSVMSWRLVILVVEKVTRFENSGI
jgi:hypothetical protein